MNEAVRGRDDALDCVKGALILLIVLGHNSFVMLEAPGLRDALYNWHVFGFFAVSCVNPVRRVSLTLLKDRFTRYYVPFIWFVSVCWLVNGLLDGSLLSAPFARLGELLVGVSIGSAELLDQAAGARLYWFIPALTGLLLLRWLCLMVAEWRVSVSVAICTLGWLGSGILAERFLTWTPFGLWIAAFVLGPALVGGWLIRMVERESRSMQIVWLCASTFFFIGSTSIAVMLASKWVLASMSVYDVRDPIRLILHSVLAVSAVVGLTALFAVLPNVKLLAAVGRASLVIYLVHQIIFFAVASVFDWAQFSGMPAGAVSFLVTVIVSFALAQYVANSWLRLVITPTGWREFRAGVAGRSS